MSNLTISEFFEHVLEAPLHCVRWSWGATDANGEVYLRCWSDEIERIDGQQFVQVQWLESTVNKNGRAERAKHLAAIAAGAQGWLIVAHAKDKHAMPRKIDGFNSEWKYRLGAGAIIKGDTLLLPIVGKEKLPSLTDVRRKAA